MPTHCDVHAPLTPKQVCRVMLIVCSLLPCDSLSVLARAHALIYRIYFTNDYLTAPSLFHRLAGPVVPKNLERLKSDDTSYISTPKLVAARLNFHVTLTKVRQGRGSSGATRMDKNDAGSNVNLLATWANCLFQGSVPESPHRTLNAAPWIVLLRLLPGAVSVKTAVLCGIRGPRSPSTPSGLEL